MEKIGVTGLVTLAFDQFEQGLVLCGVVFDGEPFLGEAPEQFGDGAGFQMKIGGGGAAALSLAFSSFSFASASPKRSGFPALNVSKASLLENSAPSRHCLRAP